jgi:hypothetical protein
MATSVKKNARVNGTGDNSQNAAPIKFSKAGEQAIAFEAEQQIHNGKLTIALIEKHVAAYKADRTYLDNAKAIMEAVRARVVAHWEKHPGHFGDNVKRSVPPVRDTRVSEFRKLVRMGDWKCADTVLAYFRNDKMTWDDALVVANYLIREVKPSGAAPKKEDIIASIHERKAAKTGRVSFDDKGKMVVNTPKTTPLDIAKATEQVARVTNGWRAFIGAKVPNGKRAEANAIVKRIIAAAGELAMLKHEA